MASADKPEFPPLLKPGLHRVQTLDLRRLCVEAFPRSGTRPIIMQGLQRLIAILESRRITGELWVDGSFLTEKIDPEDVDIVLRIESEFVDRASTKQHATLEWFARADLKPDFLCDSYALVEFPTTDPRHAIGQHWRTYWFDLFGTSRRKEPKGIAVLDLPTNTGFLLRMMAHHRHLQRCAGSRIQPPPGTIPRRCTHEPPT